jgi:hypothetical protein
MLVPLKECCCFAPPADRSAPDDTCFQSWESNPSPSAQTFAACRSAKACGKYWDNAQHFAPPVNLTAMQLSALSCLDDSQYGLSCFLPGTTCWTNPASPLSSQEILWPTAQDAVATYCDRWGGANFDERAEGFSLSRECSTTLYVVHSLHLVLGTFALCNPP